MTWPHESASRRSDPAHWCKQNRTPCHYGNRCIHLRSRRARISRKNIRRHSHYNGTHRTSRWSALS